MVFRAYGDDGAVLAERTFYSIGGGFVVDDTQVSRDDDPVVVADPTPVRYPFRTGDELLDPRRRDRTAHQRHRHGQRNDLAHRRTRSHPGC